MTEAEQVEVEDLPEVEVDTREPQARTLKRLGLSVHDELVGEDKKADRA